MFNICNYFNDSLIFNSSLNNIDAFRSFKTGRNKMNIFLKTILHFNNIADILKFIICHRFQKFPL